MSANSEISDAKAKAKMTKPLPLPSLVIKNFRGLEDVEIDPLGRVNLLVGGNNSGKTSVLEAVRLWATRCSVTALLEILGARDEDSVPSLALPGNDPARLDLSGVVNLLNGYPKLLEKTERVKIGPDQRQDCLGLQVLPVGDAEWSESISKLVVGFRDVTINEWGLDGDAGRSLRMEARRRDGEQVPPEIPSTFVSSGPLDRSDPTLSKLWDRVSLTAKGDRVIECVRLIEPRLARIGFVDSNAVNPVFPELRESRRRVPVCTREASEEPVPIKNLGDGVSRVFRLALSIVNAENGVFLIDEFENGLHYSVQEDVWKAVFEIAEQLNIQVFATTHSWDCLDAFDRVSLAREREREAVVVRLVKKDGPVYAKSFFGEKLHNLVEMEAELR